MGQTSDWKCFPIPVRTPSQWDRISGDILDARVIRDLIRDYIIHIFYKIQLGADLPYAIVHILYWFYWWFLFICRLKCLVNSFPPYQTIQWTRQVHFALPLIKDTVCGILSSVCKNGLTHALYIKQNKFSFNYLRYFEKSTEVIELFL